LIVLPGGDGEAGTGSSSNNRRWSWVQQRRNVHLGLLLEDVAVAGLLSLLLVVLLRLLRRRRRWRPGKGKDLGVIGIFGFLPTFLDGLGNWKTDRIRPFRHRLPDRIPVLSHFDAHFFFFYFTNSHETTKQQQQTTTHSPNAYGTVSTDWLTKSWPYSLRFSSQKFSTLNKSSSPSSSCFELSYTPEAASKSFHILRRDLLIMTFTSRLIDARDYTHTHAYRSWRQFLKQQQRF
jgi:hypothetical protein